MDLNLFAEDSMGNIPLNNGNLLQVTAKLKALEGFDYQTYLLYLSELKYFKNLFKFEGDTTITELSPVIMRILTEDGKVAVKRFKTKNGTKYVPFRIVDYTEGIDGHIVKGEGILSTWKTLNEQTKTYPLNSSDTVFIKNDDVPKPLLFLLWNFINKLNHYLTSADTNTKTKTKKFRYNINNNASAITAKEMSSMTDPSTPFVENITSPVGFGIENDEKKAQANKIEDIGLSSSSEVNVWDDINEFEKFWYKRFGKRMNVNFKKERNISDEFDFESANFDVLDNTIMIYLNRAVREFKEKFGLTVRVVNTVENQDKRKHKEEKEEGGE